MTQDTKLPTAVGDKPNKRKFLSKNAIFLIIVCAYPFFSLLITVYICRVIRYFGIDTNYGMLVSFGITFGIIFLLFLRSVYRRIRYKSPITITGVALFLAFIGLNLASIFNLNSAVFHDQHPEYYNIMGYAKKWDQTTTVQTCVEQEERFLFNIWSTNNSDDERAFRRMLIVTQGKGCAAAANYQQDLQNALAVCSGKDDRAC